jgi:hypothetical protein
MRVFATTRLKNGNYVGASAETNLETAALAYAAVNYPLQTAKWVIAVIVGIIGALYAAWPTTPHTMIHAPLFFGWFVGLYIATMIVFWSIGRAFKSR